MCVCVCVCVRACVRACVQVEPEKLSVSVRNEIRADLMDHVLLHHLEGCGSINWDSTITWQCCPVVRGVAVKTDGGGEAWVDAGSLADTLEVNLDRIRTMMDRTGIGWVEPE